MIDERIPQFNVPVHVTGSDYEYDGTLRAVVVKGSGTIRYVVEDSSGRLFIHNAKQLGQPDGWVP